MKSAGSSLHRPPTPSAGHSAQTAAAQTADAPKPDGVRDTIESIVVAFILAFVFRAFVVEAFVIPTGSMAPGLYGKHAEHRCTVCSYPFAYGIRAPSVGPNNNKLKGTLDEQFSVQCPNCSWRGPGNASLNSTGENRVVASSGDRILVLKWPFDIGGDLLGPKRWDVVVFKDPQNSEINFIKRLLGMPGEVLEIINGDVYAAPIENVPQDIRDHLREPPQLPNVRGGPPVDRLTQDQHQRLAKVLEIRRKTPVAQQSLWMIHYDHDFKPEAEPNPRFNPPRWKPDDPVDASPWDAKTPRVVFRPEDDREHWLELVGKPIKDGYGYNSAVQRRQHQSSLHVGDIRLRFALFPGGTEGSITLLMRKGPDEFRAIIEAAGQVRLQRLNHNGIPDVLQTSSIEPLQAGKPLTIEFVNCDFRVTLRLDGQDVLATTDDNYSPDILKLLQTDERTGDHNKAAIAIGARNLPLEIRHLTVHRDVYYRSDVKLEQNSENKYRRYPGWGTEGNPLLLRDNPPDYFCCGDNSPQSKDSRLWWEVSPMLSRRAGRDAYRHGTVPGDQMIGRAFYVYWPGGLRFLEETPAVIPNLGRMRIIR